MAEAASTEGAEEVDVEVEVGVFTRCEARMLRVAWTSRPTGDEGK